MPESSVSGLNRAQSFFIYQLKQMADNCSLAPLSFQLYITQTESLRFVEALAGPKGQHTELGVYQHHQ